ncbi:hypothetical protein LTR08_009333 [Meristemomyces frigidus]|nr:hypothetical protein LTR08_009333 [Meristemomyces frigidus]
MLLDLSDELLSHIAAHALTVQDVLRLRLVCRRLSNIAFEAQMNRLSTIYIEVSEASLQRFRDICHSRNHAAGIRKVVYIGRLNRLSRQEVLDDRMFRYDRDFYHCSQPLIDEVLASYAANYEAQCKLLANGQFEDTVSACLSLLPKLRKLRFKESPDLSLSRPPVSAEAYNRCRTWRDYDDPATFEEIRALPLEKCARDHLMWTVQYHTSTDRSLDSPFRILRSLASRVGQACTNVVEIAFRNYSVHSLASEGYAMATAQLTGALFLQSAQFITKLNMHLASCSGGPDTTNELVQLWLSFIGAMSNLKELKVNVRPDTMPIIKAMFKETYIPALEKMRINEGLSWWASFYPNRPDLYTTHDLSGFLCKHGRTLKHLHLEHATGVDPHTERPDSDALQALLIAAKTGLVSLNTANITEGLMTKDPLGSNPLIQTPGEQRVAESKSSLGQLARAFDVEAIEEVEDGCIGFKYDFGSYLTRR